MESRLNASLDRAIARALTRFEDAHGDGKHCEKPQKEKSDNKKQDEESTKENHDDNETQDEKLKNRKFEHEVQSCVCLGGLSQDNQALLDASPLAIADKLTQFVTLLLLAVSSFLTVRFFSAQVHELT